jgi:hypothetical protein
MESDPPAREVDVNHQEIEQIPTHKDIDRLAGCLFDLRQVCPDRLIRCDTDPADVDGHIRISSSGSGACDGTDPGGTRSTQPSLFCETPVDDHMTDAAVDKDARGLAIQAPNHHDQRFTMEAKVRPARTSLATGDLGAPSGSALGHGRWRDRHRAEACKQTPARQLVSMMHLVCHSK